MAIEEHIKLLQSMPFFGAINEDSVSMVLAESEVCQIPANEFFYHQGEQGDCLYVLEKGKVEILKEVGDKTIKLCDIGQGGCFGELALIACTPRSAAARATADCEVIRIPQAALANLYEQDVDQYLLLQMNMAREVCRRLQELDEQWVRYQLTAMH
jgi:CRP-like cAMP-binding protein